MTGRRILPLMSLLLGLALPAAAHHAPGGRVHFLIETGSDHRVHKLFAGEPAAQKHAAPDYFPPPAVLVPPVPTIVTTTSGQVKASVVGDGTFAFKAIPFAAPPVGSLRWAPPQAPASWQGVRDSQDSAPACLQNDYGWQTDMAAKSSEDCLYLEVRTPSLDPAAKKAVIVWLHGGANRAGGGMGTIYSAWASKDVVVVSIQYRLGVFGFLSHPALTRESGVGASGNYALMDQIKALQWVQANIAQFGGDPYNVTIVGHSAGAQDVGLLLASPLSRGLFQKAVEESGTPQFGFAPRSLAQNEAMGVALASQFSQHAPDSAEALDDLRNAPARALQMAGDKLAAPLEDQSFIWDQATVDGYVLPRAPEDIFKAGEAAHVPLIIGVSARELGLADINADINAAEDKRFGSERPAIDAFYASAPDPLYGDKAIQLSSDILLRCPVDWVAAHMSGPVWLYQLDVDKDGTVHHGSELNYVMNARPKEAAIWPPLLDYWTEFARTGKPEGKGLPAWPAYGKDKRYIEFTAKGATTGRAWRRPICSRLDRP